MQMDHTTPDVFFGGEVSWLVTTNVKCVSCSTAKMYVATITCDKQLNVGDGCMPWGSWCSVYEKTDTVTTSRANMLAFTLCDILSWAGLLHQKTWLTIDDDVTKTSQSASSAISNNTGEWHMDRETDRPAITCSPSVVLPDAWKKWLINYSINEWQITATHHRVLQLTLKAVKPSCLNLTVKRLAAETTDSATALGSPRLGFCLIPLHLPNSYTLIPPCVTISTLSFSLLFFERPSVHRADSVVKPHDLSQDHSSPGD